MEHSGEQNRKGSSCGIDMLLVGVRKYANRYIIIDNDVLWLEINWILSYMIVRKSSLKRFNLTRNLKNEEGFQAEELGSIKDLRT